MEFSGKKITACRMYDWQSETKNRQKNRQHNEREKSLQAANPAVPWTALRATVLAKKRPCPHDSPYRDLLGRHSYADLHSSQHLQMTTNPGLAESWCEQSSWRDSSLFLQLGRQTRCFWWVLHCPSHLPAFGCHFSPPVPDNDILISAEKRLQKRIYLPLSSTKAGG